MTQLSHVRRIMEQNGLINAFSMSFALMLWVRSKQNFFERLLLSTSVASFIADILLVFLSDDTDAHDLTTQRVMVFFAVVLWSVREIGLLLYTNKLVHVVGGKVKLRIYDIVFKGLLALLCFWRIIDACLRAADPQTDGEVGQIVRSIDPIYLGTLSVVEIWSTGFLVHATTALIKETCSEAPVQVFSKRMLSTGIFRVVAINLIPLCRVLINNTVSSSFDYGADASSIIYYLQVSMNLMYLIDLVLVKLDSSSIFKARAISLETL